MTRTRTLRLGTRGSDLAMVQARDVARRLEAAGHPVEVVVRSTSGDRDKESPFAAVGAPGIFVREIEQALLDGELDLAVHCYKDLPSVSPEGLAIAAVPPREDPADVLVTRVEAHDHEQPALHLRLGASLGTSAARRRALVKSHRPDVVCRELRGNVPTRLAKLRAGEHDAILLAAAGINRLREGAARGENAALELDGLALDPLCVEAFVPAPSQGALALQVRTDDAGAAEAVAALHDPETLRAVTAERELLALVQAGCEAPFGAHARPVPGSDDPRALELFAAFEQDGLVRRARAEGHNPKTLASEVYAGLGLA